MLPLRSPRTGPPGFADAVDVASACHAFRAWLFRDALPFWRDAGHEGPGRGACEHLSVAGSPGGAPFKRLRVQARQIYVYSHAALMGWADGERLAREGYDFIARHGQRPGGGWVSKLSPDGTTVLDGSADLYDQAFVLFALAWYARLTNEPEPLRLARRTLAWVRDQMAAAPGGFENIFPVVPGPRLQNPHMHMLEAVLALHETSPQDDVLSVATELVELFRSRLFDRSNGVVREFFAADWSPAPGPAGDVVEPGHQFEWAWLLDRYRRQSGTGAMAETGRLYRFGCDHGTDRHSAMVWDEVSASGAPRRRSTRLWPQTEALRAHVMTAEHDPRSAALAVQVVRNIGTRFLANCPPGTWVDQLDTDGQPVSDKIPTSSFYHIFTAYGALEDLAQTSGPHASVVADVHPAMGPSS